MGMMPLRINIFFHASKPSVYSILFFQTFVNVQEENDQAFFISR